MFVLISAFQTQKIFGASDDLYNTTLFQPFLVEVGNDHIINPVDSRSSYGHQIVTSIATQNHSTCDNLKTHAHIHGRSETGKDGTWSTIPPFPPFWFDPSVQFRCAVVPSIVTRVRGVALTSPSTNSPNRGQVSAIANTWSPLEVYL